MKAAKKIIVGLVIFFVSSFTIAICLYTAYFGPKIEIKYYDTYFDVDGGAGFFSLGNRITYSNITNFEIHDTIYGNKETAVEDTYTNYEVGGYYNDTYGDYTSFVSKASKKSVLIDYTYKDKPIRCVIGLRKTDDVLNLIDHIVDNTNLTLSYN